jgi:hypothetical protein
MRRLVFGEQVVRADVLGLITKLASISAGNLNVFHAHDLDGLLPLLQVILVDVQFHSVFLHRNLFVVQAFLQLDELLADALLVHLKETNLLRVLIVQLALQLDLVGFPVKGLLFYIEPVDLVLQLFVLEGHLLLLLVKFR